MSDMALWEAQRAAAEATERVAQRQIDLLRLQRRVIDDQLEAETRRRDNAIRDVLNAEKAIEQLTAPPQQLVVDMLDAGNPEHRERAWRGQAGEVWTWVRSGSGGRFAWSVRHPLAAYVSGKSVGGPFTELLP